MIEFSEEKTERLKERAKELRKEGCDDLQLSKIFGVPEEWFIEHLPEATKPKAKRKAEPKRKTHWYE